MEETQTRWSFIAHNMAQNMAKPLLNLNQEQPDTQGLVISQTLDLECITVQGLINLTTRPWGESSFYTGLLKLTDQVCDTMQWSFCSFNLFNNQTAQQLWTLYWIASIELDK